MKIRHILLTTDLSDEALRPFEPVLALARELGAKVTLLNVVSDLPVLPHGAPLAGPQSSPDLEKRMADTREALEEHRRRLGEGLEVVVDVTSHESPAKGVVEYADRHGVDLIALSTHGRTGFRRLALGSVAEEVLRRSRVPVLSFHRTED